MQFVSRSSKSLILAAAGLVVVLAPIRSARPCTAFLAALNGAPVIGKTYDWDMGQGLVFVNKRGVAKQSVSLKPGDRPATWVSRYMSVTFNQYGREFPNGGINEAGLVVEVLWLDATIYAVPDERPTVNEAQWIQYQLDNFANVAEAVAAIDRLRISRVYGKVHYFMCDESGACATVDVLDGKLVVKAGADLTFKTLTNNTWAESAAYAAKYAGLGGKNKAKSGTASLDRFVRAASRVAAASTVDLDNIRDEAFSILDSVAVPGRTRWFIVYMPTDSRVFFRTSKESHIKAIDVAKLDGDCATPVKMIDIDYAAEGNITEALENYAADANLALVKRSLGALAKKLPAGTIERAAGFPEQLKCQGTAP
jgi:penicillin V acylase-like amidase (Ntn superfamily)